MKQNQTIQRACQVLRHKVRYKSAGLHLDPDRPFDNDTRAIRSATRLYVESWIVPILNCIEKGDTKGLAELIRWDRGDTIDSLPD